MWPMAQVLCTGYPWGKYFTQEFLNPQRTLNNVTRNKGKCGGPTWCPQEHTARKRQGIRVGSSKTLALAKGRKTTMVHSGSLCSSL